MIVTDGPKTGDILDCGHVNPGVEAAGWNGWGPTGYARTPANFTMCYPCADVHDRAAMANANEHFGYLSGDGKSITTWTGGHLARVTQHGKARLGFHGSMIHAIRAVAPDGSQWYGRNGGEGMHIKIKRAKSSR